MQFPGLFSLIILLTDDNPAHTEQSLAVAYALSDITGAEIASFSIPKLKGLRRFLADKRKVQLLTGRREEVLSWLGYAKGDTLLRSVSALLNQRKIKDNSSKTIVISAGSEAAAYNLAVASAWNVACSVIGNPEGVGTKPFEFVIIPEYEKQPSEPNILKIVTPPNSVGEKEPDEKAKALLAKYKPDNRKIWPLLVGGSGADNSMDPEKLRLLTAKLACRAEACGAQIFAGCSARTDKKCLAVMQNLAAQNEAVHCLSPEEYGEDLYYALMGITDTVLCTEDLFGEISEAVTAGRKVVLMRTACTKGLKQKISRLTGRLVENGALPRFRAHGTARNNLVYDRFKRHGKLQEFENWLLYCGTKETASSGLDEETPVWRNFNEARRAAKWIAGSLVD